MGNKLSSCCDSETQDNNNNPIGDLPTNETLSTATIVDNINNSEVSEHAFIYEQINSSKQAIFSWGNYDCMPIKGFLNFYKKLSDDEKVNGNYNLEKNTGWKVHISLALDQENDPNLSRAYQVVHEILKSNNVYCWKVLQKGKEKTLEKQGQAGKIVTIYTFKENRTDFEEIFQEIEDQLKAENIAPGEVPHVRKENTITEVPEQKIEGSIYFYYVHEGIDEETCPFLCYDLSHRSKEDSSLTLTAGGPLDKKLSKNYASTFNSKDSEFLEEKSTSLSAYKK